jgi:GMP synthase (glutamine-hydrolysing)
MKPFLLLQSRPEDVTSDNEYEGVLKATGLEPHQLERFRVESAPLPDIDLTQFSGFIMGGGPYTTITPVEKKSDTQLRVEADFARLLQKLLDNDLPFFGICYGVGTLGGVAGGKVSDLYAEKLAIIKVSLTPEGKNDDVLTGISESFEAISGHKEALEVLPENAVLLSTSSACPIQVFRVKNNLYVSQFHPELDMEGLQIRIEAYRYAGYFPPEEADRIISEARAADLSQVSTLLKNFVKKYRVNV